MSDQIVKVLIVDDDIHSINDLKRKLAEISGDMEISELKSAESIKEYLKMNAVDLIFLDINIGNINGVKVGNLISECFPKTKIIYSTGHPEYALDEYESNPIDFLIKPINPSRLKKAILKFQKEKGNRDIRIGIKTHCSIKFIKVSDILYIEKSVRKCIIHLVENQTIETCEAINKLEKILAPYNFYCPHQSYLIPINRVLGVRKDNFMRSYNISLSGCSDLVKLSKKKYPEFRNLILKDQFLNILN